VQRVAFAASVAAIFSIIVLEDSNGLEELKILLETGLTIVVTVALALRQRRRG
jgi:hypothetical protein